MDKNTIIGFVLIAALLIGFSWYTQPSEEDIAKQRMQDSITALAKKKAEESRNAEAQASNQNAQNNVNADTTAVFYKSLSGKAQNIILKNSKLELTLSTKGGTVEKAVIKDFKDNKGNKDLTLFDSKDQSLKFMLEGKETNIITSDLYFTPSNITDSTVTMTAVGSNGRSLVMNYKLGKNYLLHFSLKANGMSGLFSPNYNKLDIEDAIDWVAFKNQFFSAVMIAKDDLGTNSLMTSIPQEKGSGYLKQYGAKVKTSFDPTGNNSTELEFYYGPNDFRLLQKIEKESTFNKDLELHRLVYLGWPLFRIINRWFTLYVFDWLTGLNINMGIVLILITLLLKVITYPLVKKSYMSSAKMRVLKPKLEEATKQYNKPEDQMQKQQAMMALYAKYGVSPLSGCLPMLIQMPIWIAMFNFVPNAIQLRGESFLWISDLSTYDPIIEWHNNIWLIGDHLSLTCILFCVANVLYSIMTIRQQKDQMVGAHAEQMKMMQWMTYLMPVMFFFMFNDYSSGLNFYYFVSLFFSAAIMWTLRKTTNDEKLLSILEARYQENKNNPKKMSGLAARLEAMQKQAEELKRQREAQDKMRK